ncbi:hypothetical protein BDN72DRAFT_832639 [Pluteus cervinus]|uniref:Uncharacterized protein n=1 Tax=Pluteus cervinus TaxID=181527 RepID=A0ACD3BA50_9AGAR|nr:hypothetical protein BDN72DRAFT_832639 [Pluteus cervinus]
MSVPSSSLGARFQQACAGLGAINSDPALLHDLDFISQELARSKSARIQLGSHDFVWPEIRKLWKDVARIQLTFWDADDSDGGESEGERLKQQGLQLHCSTLAKFTRNLVAGVPDNQDRAFENEPEIRRLLHYYTSWSAMEDKQSMGVARVLAQAVANLVTENENRLSDIWNTYMRLPEDQVVLIRLLASPDDRTQLTVLIFILNCIHGSRDRIKMLTRTKNGVRICISLLDSMVRLYDADEGSEGGQAFDVGYSIFTTIMEENLVPELWKNFSNTGEIITPYQTTLLKLVDSYLQSQCLSSPGVNAQTIKMHNKLGKVLANTFLGLSAYGRQALQRSLGPAGSPVSPEGNHSSSPRPGAKSHPLSPSFLPAELDILLPKVCEALVLVTQCITTISLQSEEYRTDYLECSPASDGPDIVPKDYFNEITEGGQGIIEDIIDLLYLLDLFLPRINFGKSVSSPHGSLSPSAASSTSSSSPPKQSKTTSADGAGFSYLKRDLVRLLGVLCHKDRTVQDRVRNKNGLTVVMNLCVIDERNPYMREHAIFTLHNLLEDNTENQEVVNSITLSSTRESPSPSTPNVV